MKTACLHLVLLGFVLAKPLFAQELNVLIIGSNRSFSETAGKPFDPPGVANQSASIPSRDTSVTPTVNMLFEDIRNNRSVDAAEPELPAFEGLAGWKERIAQ